MNFRTTLALAILPVTLLHAQTPLPLAAPPIFSARSTLVLVPALVRTHTGELVFTLTARDFTLTDDAVEQKLTLEEGTGEQPLALVVVVQTGAAAVRQLNSVHSLAPMLEAIVGNIPHHVAIVTFDSVPRLVQDFSSDLPSTAESLQGLSPGDSGAAILDSLAVAVDLLRKQPPQYRRAVLLVSERSDHGSRAQMEDALRAIIDTNTAIYSVAFSSSKDVVKHQTPEIFFGSTGPPGGCMSRDPTTPSGSRLAQTWDCLSLLAPPLRATKIAAILGMNAVRPNVPESVAHLTGGEYYAFHNTRTLEEALQTISNHIPNRYVLSFQPQSPHPGLHTLRLRLSDYPDLEVTARSSYWADASPQP